MASAQEKQLSYIWEKLPKQKDGDTICYIKGDIAYLYYNGFVNTAKHSYEEWETFFSPFKQEDGSYILNKDQFLTLGRFRYVALNYEPFDAFKIQQGPWPQKALQGLYNKTIKLATLIPENAYWKLIDTFKAMGKVDKSGVVVIDNDCLKLIDKLAKTFPSPRARLERAVQNIKDKRDQKVAEHQKDRDASSFSIGQTSSEVTREQWQHMQSSQVAEETQQALSEIQDDDAETLDIKSLRRGSKRKTKF